MTDQNSADDNIQNTQFYDNEKYYDIYENILTVNKNYIQEYLKELNVIRKDLDKRIDNKIVELQMISQSKEKNNKKLNREYIRNILIKEYKTNITNKRNKRWNNVLIKSLNINPITTITNDDYINFYDRNKIVLIPSYLDNDKKNLIIFVVIVV